MARIMVESLRRLYHDGKIPKEKIDALYERSSITKEEHLYILSGETPESTECSTD